VAQNETSQAKKYDIREVAFRNLVVAIMVDGRVEPSERAWVHYARRLLGLDPRTANKWIREMAGGQLKLRIPDKEEDKKLCFDLMIGACKADGKVAPQEAALLKAFAPRFGVAPEDVEERMKKVTLQTIEEEVAASRGQKPPPTKTARPSEPETPPDAAAKAVTCSSCGKPYTGKRCMECGALAGESGSKRPISGGLQGVVHGLKDCIERFEAVIEQMWEEGAEEGTVHVVETMSSDLQAIEKAIMSGVDGDGRPATIDLLGRELCKMCDNMKAQVDSPIGARYLGQHHNDVKAIVGTAAELAAKLANSLQS
jgi:hypothetical protein